MNNSIEKTPDTESVKIREEWIVSEIENLLHQKKLTSDESCVVKEWAMFYLLKDKEPNEEIGLQSQKAALEEALNKLQKKRVKHMYIFSLITFVIIYSFAVIVYKNGIRLLPDFEASITWLAYFIGFGVGPMYDSIYSNRTFRGKHIYALCGLNIILFNLIPLILKI
ncbi:MAG: hypothetical protein WCQ49_01555 [Candidatus Saccharibacteria bacterium]